MSTLLDRKRHVMDVPLYLRLGLECNCLPADDTRDRTSDYHLLTRDHSRHSAFLADNNFYGHHVTLNLTIDLKHSTADDLQPLAHDLEVVPDDRLLAG
jgi:hypothetical protein